MSNDLQERLDMVELITLTAGVKEHSSFVLAMSGGMDSSALYFELLERGHLVLPVVFNYGSKHNPYENKAAINICHAAEVLFPVNYIRPLVLNLTEVFASLGSALMKHGADIPEGHYKAESMKSTVVPGRNLIFAAVLASIAESRGMSYVALGVHSGDHHIYPDCRPDFCRALLHTVKFSSDGKVRVKAPYLNMSKSSIIRAAQLFDHRMPFELTRTCYKDQPVSCGKCGSCTERLEAFLDNKIVDPLEYEGGI